METRSEAFVEERDTGEQAPRIHQYTALRQEGGQRLKGNLIRAHNGFLSLPAPVVLPIMWLAGVALLSLCGLTLYLLWLELQAL